MSFAGGRDAVQRSFPDQFGIGFPGQLWRASAGIDVFIDSYPNQDTHVFCGRMVVEGDPIDHSSGAATDKAAFAIRQVELTTVAADLVGIVIRPYSGAFNITDTDADVKAGFLKKYRVSVLQLGSKQEIIVRQDPITVTTVAHGNLVYVAINPTNDANIAIGEFSNAAGAGLIEVPNAIWSISKTVTNDDSVGVIKLL